MEWFEKEHSLPPEPGKLIIVYSPERDYTDEDQLVNNSILFRIIDSQFLHIAREATHWTYLEKPQT